ncbi:MAG: tRNA pseudouridine(13) synthase TruD, partial [Candidatus Bathyarchaeota archaeon]|nr:tRNA pseudouridine(13) synthase TruD [Candidatus Bathyarchaeota archaeon]
MRVPLIEKQIGIEAFATRTMGIGGVIKEKVDDFVVEEVLVDGSKSSVNTTSLPQVTGEGRYLHCFLVKRGWDTLMAMREISRQLGIKSERIQIVGLKDKKATTSQHLSIENIRAEKLRTMREQVDNLRIIPHHYSQNMLFPHMLFGNSFNITIRNVNHSSATTSDRISETMNRLLDLGGIPNFFGHQRFGTIRPITHSVGKALVRNDLETAVQEFTAKPSPHENPASREARQKLLETGDFKKALNFFPKWLLYERLILSHLAKNPRDYQGALRKLPKQLCRLFVQGYQSYLYNRFLSQRLNNGIPINQPQIGDYVSRIDRYGLPTRTHVKANGKNLENLENDVKSGRMYIALPLIGFRQPLSEGVEGKMEESILR